MPIDRLWVGITREQLATERSQASDEGRTFERVEDEFERVHELLGEDPYEHQDRAGDLLDRTADLPVRDDYEYEEPSDIERIRAARPDERRSLEFDPDPDELSDGLLGAWQGRCGGCLLGKPFETWERDRIRGFLDAADIDLSRGYARSDVPDHVAGEYRLEEVGEYQRAFVDELDHMPRDDDVDYTIAALEVLEEHGGEFTSEDIAGFWLSNVPAYNTFTAERVAYRNLLNLELPPESATHRNPYREAIGALIRADCYGYVSPGDPERAAELAWRDARVSHVKNGIYGAMWVAAMTAAAHVLDGPEATVRTGLEQVPVNSRLASAVGDVLDWHEDGISYDEAVERIHDRWDETDTYEWLHTVCNAQVNSVALLWGEGDYGRSVARAVRAGFDTDSNGATVGSLLGLMNGARALPDRRVDPLSDRVDTALAGHPQVRISELADRTLECARRLA